MKKAYIFCHGFGFNETYWNNLALYFHGEPCIYLNLGYFGTKFTSLPFNLTNHQLVGIGHSLGLSRLLQSPLPFNYLIGLNGFVNFLGNNPLLGKKRSIELKFLKQSFTTNETNALLAFYKRCRTPKEVIPSITTLNKSQLLTDLDLLKDKVDLNPSAKIFIIGSKNDIIVPPSLILDNFASYPHVKQIILDDGGHALGANLPLKVKILIDEFLNDKL